MGRRGASIRAGSGQQRDGELVRQRQRQRRAYGSSGHGDSDICGRCAPTEREAYHQSLTPRHLPPPTTTTSTCTQGHIFIRRHFLSYYSLRYACSSHYPYPNFIRYHLLSCHNPQSNPASFPLPIAIPSSLFPYHPCSNKLQWLPG